MPYIVFLLIILTLIFSVVLKTDFFSGSFTAEALRNLPANVLQKLKDKTIEVVSPKSEKEIMIDNLNSNYNILDRFFSESAPKILSSQNVSQKDKEAIKQAEAAFTASKNLVSDIQNFSGENKSIIQSIIEKIINTEIISGGKQTEPTSIPPNCQMTCK